MIQKIIKAFQALIVFLILLILVYPLIIVSSYYLVFRNKVYPKVDVINFNLGGQDKKTALEILTNKINEANIKNIIIEYQDKTWEINLNELGFNYLTKETVDQAYNFGRDEDLKKDIILKWKAWQQGILFGLDYNLNNHLLEEQIATISSTINIPAIPPTIEIKQQPTKEISIEPGKSGKKVDEKQLYQSIKNNLSWLNNEKINLPVEDIYFLTSEQQIDDTKKRAQNLLNKTIILSWQQNQWPLEEKEIINFLNFNYGFDDNKIASYTAQLARSIDRSAENALFNFDNGRVIEFKPAENGQILDQKKTTDLLKETLIKLEKEDINTATINLPVSLIKPQIAIQDVNNLGIKELIGQGESWFKGSIASRIHNIKLASQKLNGLLIPTREVFSFNQSLGEVSMQTGFQQAYIIKEGRTVLGDGGGICQVSTTLFRAALNAGLPIEERTAHAYRVSYYEQNYQAGVDATVFEPQPDFKFKNDTSGNILIQSKIDLTNLKLTFALYGSWDGREVIVSNSRVWDQIPPPPDLYQDDPTLPMGTVKQVDWKAWGAKVVFDWKVIRGNDILQDRAFYSIYKPWQAVYLRGTAEQ